MTAAERVGVYAIFGGVPAILTRVNPNISIRANVEQETMVATGIFRSEAFHSRKVHLRDTHSYHSILQAIGQGHRTHDQIALHSGIARTSLPKYLSRLISLAYIVRRLPATVPLKQRGRSRQSRYALADQFLRFPKVSFHLAQPHLASSKGYFTIYGTRLIAKCEPSSAQPSSPNSVRSGSDSKLLPGSPPSTRKSSAPTGPRRYK